MTSDGGFLLGCVIGGAIVMLGLYFNLGGRG